MSFQLMKITCVRLLLPFVTFGLFASPKKKKKSQLVNPARWQEQHGYANKTSGPDILSMRSSDVAIDGPRAQLPGNQLHNLMACSAPT